MSTFDELDQRAREKLFSIWQDGRGDHKMMSNYRDLFMQLEDVISDAMDKDRSEKHSRLDRMWTPPPRPNKSS